MLPIEGAYVLRNHGKCRRARTMLYSSRPDLVLNEDCSKTLSLTIALNHEVPRASDMLLRQQWLLLQERFEVRRLHTSKRERTVIANNQKCISRISLNKGILYPPSAHTTVRSNRFWGFSSASQGHLAAPDDRQNPHRQFSVNMSTSASEKDTSKTSRLKRPKNKL